LNDNVTYSDYLFRNQNFAVNLCSINNHTKK
jgi:hypothetical protein